MHDDAARIVEHTARDEKFAADPAMPDKPSEAQSGSRSARCRGHHLDALESGLHTLASQRARGGHADVFRPRVPVQLTTPYRKQAGRAHLVRATLRRAGDALVATPLANQSSGALTSMRQVDALVEVAAEVTQVDAGSATYAWLLRAC